MCCLKDRDRTVAGQTETIGQRFERDRAAADPLPARAFDACVPTEAKVDKYQTVRFDKNRYSTPRNCAFRAVTVKGYINHIEVVANGRVVARHDRCYGRGEQILDPVHYLVTLGRRPAALDGFTIYGGKADQVGTANEDGGGMKNKNVLGPAVQNCTFLQNYAFCGGGMINVNSDASVIDRVFRENIAAERGGGMDNLGGVPILTDCLFEGNEAGETGGGLHVKGAPSSFTITGCDFIDNKANMSVADFLGGGGLTMFFVNRGGVIFLALAPFALFGGLGGNARRRRSGRARGGR